MALVLANRVQETTTTTGTGTITLAGAVSGFQSFAAIGNANTTYYTITSGTDWEVGIGTYTLSGTTLARTTILSSSIGGGAITLAGTSNVFATYPAEKSVNLDASGNATALGTPASGTVTNLTGTASININGTVGATTATTGAFTTITGSTSLTTPLISGGTAAASNLTIQSTSGAGTTDFIAFRTASQTERARFVTGGAFALGTTAPDASLHIQGIRGGNGRMTQSATGGTSLDNLNIIASSSAGSADQWFSYGVTSGNNFFIQTGVGSGTSGLVITSGNSVLINESSASGASLVHNFEVNGDIMSTGSGSGLFWANRSTAPSSGADWYGWYTSSGTIFIYNPAVGNIASITAATGAYTALSDGAKKKDFEPSAIGLDAIMALKPTLFRMQTDADDTPKQLGFIAQDVKDCIPQAYVEQQNIDAGGNDATYIGLNDRPIIAALVKAVQEQQATINDLCARVVQLEGN